MPTAESRKQGDWGIIEWKEDYKTYWKFKIEAKIYFPLCASSCLRVERRWEWRTATRRSCGNDLCRYARRFGEFFETSKRLLIASVWLNGTVPIFHREECNEWTLLQTKDKLIHEARMLMAFAVWMRDERKEQVPTNMTPQKMWQTWSLSDLAGEPNTSNGRPPNNILRSKP